MSTQVVPQQEHVYAEQFASILEQLNKKVESTADAAVAFAPPQTHDGLMVIPVAKVKSRFGSGFGTGKPKEQEDTQGGVGVGGTLSVTPMGYIELKEGVAKFRPILTADSIVRMQVAGGLIAALILGSVSTLLGRRQTKKNTLFGHRQVKKGQGRRGPVFNVVFSPGANILAGRGRARRRAWGRRLNEKKTRRELPRQIGSAMKFLTLASLIRAKRPARTKKSA